MVLLRLCWSQSFDRNAVQRYTSIKVHKSTSPILGSTGTSRHLAMPCNKCCTSSFLTSAMIWKRFTLLHCSISLSNFARMPMLIQGIVIIWRDVQSWGLLLPIAPKRSSNRPHTLVIIWGTRYKYKALTKSNLARAQQAMMQSWFSSNSHKEVSCKSQREA